MRLGTVYIMPIARIKGSSTVHGKLRNEKEAKYMVYNTRRKGPGTYHWVHRK